LCSQRKRRRSRICLNDIKIVALAYIKIILMKIILSILFICISIITFGQKATLQSGNSIHIKLNCRASCNDFKSQPLVFLDSVLIPYCMLESIDPNDILSVDVIKDAYNSNLNTAGKIYITSKKKKKLNLQTIVDANMSNVSIVKPIQLIQPEVSNILISDNKE
jgi:hypothetical protein